MSYNQKELSKIVEKELKDIFSKRVPKELYEPLSYFLELGGKRIRPTLVLAACNLYKEDLSEAIQAAIAIELFHNFTLIHDDVMDNADLRRGKTTVHTKYDLNTAILSGDSLLIEAYKYLNKISSDKLSKVLSVFNETAQLVCEGQQYDINYETAQNVSVEDYLNMIQLKTAELLSGSLVIGGIIGGAPAEDLKNLRDFGINIGIAFQLQDDLLDSLGDETKLGKKIGGDITQNKKTFLLLKALELADDKTKVILNNLLKENNIPEQKKIETVVKIYNQLHIKELTEKKIAELSIIKAQESLNKISVAIEKKSILQNFILLLTKREY